MAANGTLPAEAADHIGKELLKGVRDRDRRLVLASAVDPIDKGALIVREHRGSAFYEAKWRDFAGSQRKRRLGRAWVTRNAVGEWVKRPGRIRPGFLDERRAYALMPKVIAAHEEEVRRQMPALRKTLFEDAAAAWLEYLQTEKRIKPSTLSGYRSLLAEPATKRKARIMRAFRGRPLHAITANEVQGFLAKLDREPISARTVNIHRQVLHSIFEYARREDSFRLATNPAAVTTKRPEDGAKPIDTFEPDEIRLVAAAAADGRHRGRGGYRHSAYSPSTIAEWERVNNQDAGLFTIAAFTGLRLGELLALRWRDINFEGGVLTVARAMSAGRETSTKSRRSRTVPLARQAKEALDGLQHRARFTGRDDFAFCGPDGGPLDRSAVRKRFIRAQERAGVRVRRFHDLRHTFGSLAIRRFDLVTVKEMMGHSKLTTTERYLHSKPRPTDAARLTAIFDARN